jgi:hypothetical protein
MDVVFAAVLFMLVAAVVLLFAMVGELSARVSGSMAGAGEPPVGPLDEARLGEKPGAWPEPLGAMAQDPEPVLLVVLSSSCTSCERVAGQLAADLDAGGMPAAGILLSTAEQRLGEDFVERHRLGRLPYYVDERGEWVMGAFGVQTSPAALTVRDGRLESALVFTDLRALQAQRPTREGTLV